MNTLDTFRNNMKKKREEQGITLKEIAEVIGVKEATVQRYESGKGIKSIPYETIIKIADILNCTPSYLMGWESEQEYIDGTEEAKLVKKYSRLSKANKQAVMTLIDNLLEAQSSL